MDSIDISSPLTEVIDASAHLGDGALSVPASGWLMGADFAREGYDLVVSGGEGQQFIVMDYFASDVPLDLATAENGTLRGDIVAQMAGPLNPGEYAQAAATAPSEPIGVVETLQGVVEATRADGSKVNLAQGDPIFRGDLIETGSNSNLSMVMADDSVFSLDAEGTVKMDELVYDPEDQEGNMSVSLVKGVFSFVSGQIAKTDPDAMVLNTPMATVGIRGTTGIMDLPEGGSVQIVLAPDDNGVTGELTIQPLGLDGQPFGDPVTVNIPLAAVGVAPGGASQTFTIPAAQFQQQYGAAVSRAQQAQRNTADGDDDDGGGDGDEVQGDDGIETKSATQAADEQDNSDGAEQEAEDQDNSDEAEEEARDQDQSGENDEEDEEEEGGDDQEEEEEEDDGESDGGDEEDEEEDNEESGESGGEGEGGGGSATQTVSGTSSFNFTSGMADVIVGSTGVDDVNANMPAQAGDSVDLLAGTDVLTLLYPSNVLDVYNTESIFGSNGVDMITGKTAFGTGDLIDLGMDTDTLNLFDGNHSGVTVRNTENINGGTGNDNLILNLDGSNSLTSTIDLMGAPSNDSLSLTGTGGIFTLMLSNVENVASTTNVMTTITMNTTGTSFVVSLGAGASDTLNLADGANNAVTASGIENINGGDDNDTVTALNADIDGGTFNGGAQNDTLRWSDAASNPDLAGITSFETFTLLTNASQSMTLNNANVASGQTLTINGSVVSAGLTVNGAAETDGMLNIIGGGGADTFTGGSQGDTFAGGVGADMITTGGGSDIVRFFGSTEFGDTVTDFTAGGGGDILDFSATTVGGLVGTAFTSLAGEGTASATGGLVVYLSDITLYNTAAGVAAGLDIPGGLSAGDDRLFVIGRDAGSATFDAHVWHWQDGVGGASDGNVDAGELTSVAELSGVDPSSLTAANFSDFA